MGRWRRLVIRGGVHSSSAAQRLQSRVTDPFGLRANRGSNRQPGTSLLDAIYLELHALAEVTAVTETGG